MKKVLVVCGQEIIEIRNDGGKKCSYRNYELYSNVFGKENTFLIMFSNVNDKNNNQNIIRYPTHKSKINKYLNVLNGNLFSGEKSEDRIVQFIKDTKINIIIFERSIFGSLIEKIKEQHLNSMIWVFAHNIECNYFRNKIKISKLYMYIPYKKVVHSEKVTYNHADYIMALTNRDATLIHKIYNKKVDMVLPMSFYDIYDNSKANVTVQPNNELLFIGSMFGPNYEGIKWFVENVMVELPDYHLSIVGKNFETRKNLQKENVTVVGTVDDLEPYYYSNNIMVMPIFYGDGMKIKTAEAMMYGKIILASDEALEGYEVKNIKGIYRCNTKEDYINCLKMINYDNTETQLEVRKLFTEKYSLEVQIKNCKKIWRYQ